MRRVYRNTVMPFTMRDKNESGLCGTCRFGHVMRGERLADHVIACANFHPVQTIRFVVQQCSDYKSTTTQTRHDMERVAWVLEVKKGKPVGFRPPQPRGASSVDDEMADRLADVLD